MSCTKGANARVGPFSEMMRLIWLLLCAVLSGAVVHAQEGTKQIRVGVTAFRDKLVTINEWQPTMAFLESHIPGVRFEVVPLNMPEFESELRAKSLDFLITNPQHYIAVESKFSVSRIATLVKSEGGQIVNQFGGVIFTRADRNDIQELHDIRNKRIVATDKTSFAGYLIQYDELLEHGVNLEKEPHLAFLGFPQDLSVRAVLERRADVGFARSGLLESMVREGKLDLSQIKVLHQQTQHNFPFLLSSRLYPEWPLAAAPHVSIDISNQVVAALLLMPANSDAARSGRYYRWSTPVEYLSVQSLMQRRHIYPFDTTEPITLQAAVREYAVPLFLASLIVAMGLALLYWRTLGLNQALLESRMALKDLAHHDALTGLPNRNLLDDRLDQALAQARRENHAVALCMLDLDGFKPINDKLGHDTGDRVLKDVARRIKTSLREGDTVARFGGDEFVILLNGYGDAEALGEIVQRIISSISEELDYCQGLRVMASVGVSIWGADAQDATSLLRHADEAMYQAKAAGGNRYLRFTEGGLRAT